MESPHNIDPASLPGGSTPESPVRPPDFEVDQIADDILERAQTIAVVGLTTDPTRADHDVALYLQQQGYRIIPVNPSLTAPVLGETPYPNLAAVPEPIDVVDIFRRPEFTDAHIDEAIAVRAKAVWLQLGIRNTAGIARARSAGLRALDDRCMKVEYRRWKAARR
jgi:predicted CoA-binding protein